MNRKAYTTDLTNPEWAILQPLIPPALAGGRPRTQDRRQILNAIFYILRGVALGGSCPTIFHRGKQFMTTSAAGAGRVRGKQSIAP